jgi:tetratricopeptide (TPR) repeat protein
MGCATFRLFLVLTFAQLFVLTQSAHLVAAQSPRDPQDLLKEATSLQQAGKLDQAVEDYRLLLQQYPNVAAVHSNLGAALAGLGRYQDAIEEYNRALKLQLMPQVQMNLALAYYKIGRLTDAADAFERAHQLMPRDSRPVLLEADCYLRLGDNKKVIQLLTPIEQQAPDDLAVTYMLGTALVRDGKAGEGQIRIEKILKNGDSAEARLLLGTTKLMVSDFAGALGDLQRAVELNPDLPDIYPYYGAALMATGDQDGARKAFEKALEQDPNNFDANLRIGFLLRNDKEFDEALRYFRHALEIRPGDPGVGYQIASIELSQGQVEQARKDLESLVKSAPNFTEAHGSLATVYYRGKRKVDGDRERAIVDRLTAERQSADTQKVQK